jgi:hypothetical protein
MGRFGQSSGGGNITHLIMKTLIRNVFISLLPLVVFSLVFSGCSKTKVAKAVAQKVTVVMDPSLENQRVLVDLVGVNPNQRRQWQDKSMTEYWGDADPLRNSARKHTMEFSKTNAPQTLEISAPIWKEWLNSGTMELFVLADLPNMGRGDDKPGDADARRRILSLDPSQWAKNTKELRVLIKRGGLEVVSQQQQTR